MLETKIMYRVKCSNCGKFLKSKPKSQNTWFESLRDLCFCGHDNGWDFYWDYHKALCPDCQKKGIKI